MSNVGPMVEKELVRPPSGFGTVNAAPACGKLTVILAFAINCSTSCEERVRIDYLGVNDK